jgi:Tfp pilus assembly protein PilE
MKRFLKYIKSTKGQSLAEFAVTTAMMATLATTAAPKFSGVGEGAKEKKTLADIDKIMKSANNFYNAKVTSDGRGRFPGQNKYNETVPATGGYANEAAVLAHIKGDDATFTTFDHADAAKWASVFSTTNPDAGVPSGSSVNTSEDDNGDTSFDEYIGAEEFLNEFGGNAVKSPFQDGHYIYTVIAGSGSGTSSISPILFIADLESAKNFHKKLQP